MGKRLAALVSILLVFAAGTISSVSEPSWVTIRGGRFMPLYGALPGQPVEVKDFGLDRLPVTNAEFAKFLSENPDFAPGRISRLFADDHYLAHWREGDSEPNQPVVNVSWFAASEYCAWKGGRLPTVIEWERAAAADETREDASREPDFVRRLLDWYGQPGNKPLPEVGAGVPNLFGVHDMHGVVWEWTGDFNSVFVSGDNRRDAQKNTDLFCGMGSMDASDRANYAAFLRYAMRSSLQGHYTMNRLGFRCAYDRR